MAVEEGEEKNLGIERNLVYARVEIRQGLGNKIRCHIVFILLVYFIEIISFLLLFKKSCWESHI